MVFPDLPACSHLLLLLLRTFLMLLIYNLSLLFYEAGIFFAALFGNHKAKLWIEGRKNWRSRLSAALGKEERRVWFHCSSLGEFEQGRPVMEGWKKKFPEIKIVL